MTTLTPHTVRAMGTILTAVIYNNDHINHYLNALALDANFANFYTRAEANAEFIPNDTTGSVFRRRMVLGIDGEEGPEGPPGPLGRRGPKGATGTIGPIGQTGPRGRVIVVAPSDGVDGADGLRGPRGPRGATGATGAAGPTGATGPTGPSGASNADVIMAVLETGRDTANSNTNQAWFPANTADPEDALTVEDDSTYLVEWYWNHVRSAGSTSHQVGHSLAVVADAVIDEYLWQSFSRSAAGTAINTTTSNSFGLSTAEAIMVNTGASTTLNQLSRGVGILRVSTGGTIQPLFRFTAAPGAAGILRSGTFYRLVKIGVASFNKSSHWVPIT